MATIMGNRSIAEKMLVLGMIVATLPEFRAVQAGRLPDASTEAWLNWPAHSECLK